MTEDQFEKLAQLIQNSHEDLSGEIQGLESRMEERFEGIDARFGNVDARFDKIDNEFAYLRNELKDIRARLDELAEKVEQQSGYAKEIDYILSRIVVIEQRLGIAQTAAD